MSEKPVFGTEILDKLDAQELEIADLRRRILILENLNHVELRRLRQFAEKISDIMEATQC